MLWINQLKNCIFAPLNDKREHEGTWKSPLFILTKC